ncbi:hypothetical protein PR048_013804 [Dryococelus australis]|uniref:Uncharacterized protein n=1 Tax=Dryococelus australis TaxID=614101 RepID=A0ABQ9HTM4_9NEOP|nr:hypothetical protein PR048_013804 [Dryococelus australis]
MAKMNCENEGLPLTSTNLEQRPASSLPGCRQCRFCDRSEESFRAIKQYDIGPMSFVQGDTMKEHIEIFKGSSTGSQLVMSPIPPATSMVDELQNKLSSALYTYDDHMTSTKESKLHTEVERGCKDDHIDIIDDNDYSDSVDEDDDDSLDKAEDAKNTGYMLPEDLNELVDRLRILIAKQKGGDYANMEGVVLILSKLKDRGNEGLEPTSRHFMMSPNCHTGPRYGCRRLPLTVDADVPDPPFLYYSRDQEPDEFADSFWDKLEFKRLTPRFSHVGIVPDDAVGRRVFSGISRASFRCCSILTSITLIGSQDLAVNSLPNIFTLLTHLRALYNVYYVLRDWLGLLPHACYLFTVLQGVLENKWPNHKSNKKVQTLQLACRKNENISCDQVVRKIHNIFGDKLAGAEGRGAGIVWRGKGVEWAEWNSARIQGREKREIPEKTRQPAASCGTIPTCENLVVTRPGIEPDPWWEARSLTAQPPWLQQFEKVAFNCVERLENNTSCMHVIWTVRFLFRSSFNRYEIKLADFKQFPFRSANITEHTSPGNSQQPLRADETCLNTLPRETCRENQVALVIMRNVITPSAQEFVALCRLRCNFLDLVKLHLHEAEEHPGRRTSAGLEKSSKPTATGSKEVVCYKVVALRAYAALPRSRCPERAVHVKNLLQFHLEARAKTHPTGISVDAFNTLKNYFQIYQSIEGARVAERLDCSPSTKANRVQFSLVRIVPDDDAGRPVVATREPFLLRRCFCSMNVHLPFTIPDGKNVVCNRREATPVTFCTKNAVKETNRQPPVQLTRSVLYVDVDSIAFVLGTESLQTNIYVRFTRKRVSMLNCHFSSTEFISWLERISFHNALTIVVFHCNRHLNTVLVVTFDRDCKDLQARLYSIIHIYVDINCTLVVCCHSGKRQLDTILQEVSNTVWTSNLSVNWHSSQQGKYLQYAVADDGSAVWLCALATCLPPDVLEDAWCNAELGIYAEARLQYPTYTLAVCISLLDARFVVKRVCFMSEPIRIRFLPYRPSMIHSRQRLYLTHVLGCVTSADTSSCRRDDRANNRPVMGVNLIPGETLKCPQPILEHTVLRSGRGCLCSHSSIAIDQNPWNSRVCIDDIDITNSYKKCLENSMSEISHEVDYKILATDASLCAVLAMSITHMQLAHDREHRAKMKLGIGTALRDAGDRGGVGVRLLTPHLGETGSIPGGVTAGFLHVGIVTDDATGFDVSPSPLVTPGAVPYSPRFALIGSQDLSVESRPDLFTRMKIIDWPLVLAAGLARGDRLHPTASPGGWPPGRRSHELSANLASPHTTNLYTHDESMEQRQNERAGETGDLREILPTSGIVRHDSCMRKPGGEQTNHYTTAGLTLFANYRLVTYSPAGRPANTEYYITCNIQSEKSPPIIICCVAPALRCSAHNCGHLRRATMYVRDIIYSKWRWMHSRCNCVDAILNKLGSRTTTLPLLYGENEYPQFEEVATRLRICAHICSVLRENPLLHAVAKNEYPQFEEVATQLRICAHICSVLCENPLLHAVASQTQYLSPDHCASSERTSTRKSKKLPHDFASVHTSALCYAKNCRDYLYSKTLDLVSNFVVEWSMVIAGVCPRITDTQCWSYQILIGRLSEEIWAALNIEVCRADLPMKCSFRHRQLLTFGV